MATDATAAERRVTMGCMCMECRFMRVVEDENFDLFPICGNRILDTGHSWNYCPNCGARMDGDDDG